MMNGVSIGGVTPLGYAIELGDYDMCQVSRFVFSFSFFVFSLLSLCVSFSILFVFSLCFFFVLCFLFGFGLLLNQV